MKLFAIMNCRSESDFDIEVEYKHGYHEEYGADHSAGAVILANNIEEAQKILGENVPLVEVPMDKPAKVLVCDGEC